MKMDECNYSSMQFLYIYCYEIMKSIQQSDWYQTDIWNKKTILFKGAVWWSCWCYLCKLPEIITVTQNNWKRTKKVKPYFHSHCGICGAMIHFIYNTTCPRSYFFYFFQIFYCETMFLWIEKSFKFAFPPNISTEYLALTQIRPMFLSYRNQSTGSQCKSIYWFLYDGYTSGLNH